ncbi:hypothetical protein CUC08_Gglean007167 [Alternaria sp. MG1]|nr:hypothetical protein CUC08_Gglean007167 [Alternaria sp. MG1]
MAQGRILISLRSHKLILVPVRVPSTARTAHGSIVGAAVIHRSFPLCASKLEQVATSQRGKCTEGDSRLADLRVEYHVSFLGVNSALQHDYIPSVVEREGARLDLPRDLLLCFDHANDDAMPIMATTTPMIPMIASVDIWSSTVFISPFALRRQIPGRK